MKVITNKDVVLNMLESFEGLSSGLHKEYFKLKKESLKEVEICKTKDILTKEQLERLNYIAEFKIHECYKNATLTAQILESLGVKDVKYVEGFVLVCGFPVDHAFNCIGDKYFDITNDLVFDENSTNNYPHFVIGEWSFDKALDAMLKRGFYGGVFEEEFRSKYKNK